MMLSKIKSKGELTRFITSNVLENGVGIIISAEMPQDSYVVLDIDKYYHHIGLARTPEIADILLVAQRLSQNEQHHIYIVEMKNVRKAKYFNKKNIYEKFHTAIEDFMKTKYPDIFMNQNYKVERFRLFFVSDAYRLKKEG